MILVSIFNAISNKKAWNYFSVMFSSELWKNILIDFIGKKVFSLELFYGTSDLGKILGRFNSAIQAQKLIVMNKTGMSSGD